MLKLKLKIKGTIEDRSKITRLMTFVEKIWDLILLK